MKTLRYCPELNEITGGVTSTLLMMQLEYWFEKTDGKMFFKFLEPCEDEHYRKGGSWCEELGMSKGEFRTAFGRIGKVYKSKKEFKASKDKFEGKMYLSYFDRIKRLTFYMRNEKLVNQYLNLEKAEEVSCRSEEASCPITLDYVIDYSINELADTEEMAPYEQIVEAYHEICEELPKVKKVSKGLKERISKIWKLVGEDMSRIVEVMQKVSKSDFLSGRIKGKFWKASLEWMMQEEKFNKIRAGQYEDKKKKPNKFNRMMSHNWNFTLLEALEQEYIEQQAKNNLKRLEGDGVSTFMEGQIPKEPAEEFETSQGLCLRR